MQPASFLSPLFLAVRIHDDADGFLTIEASPNCRLSIFHRHCSLSLSLSLLATLSPNKTRTATSTA